MSKIVIIATEGRINTSFVAALDTHLKSQNDKRCYLDPQNLSTQTFSDEIAKELRSENWTSAPSKEVGEELRWELHVSDDKSLDLGLVEASCDDLLLSIETDFDNLSENQRAADVGCIGADLAIFILNLQEFQVQSGGPPELDKRALARWLDQTQRIASHFNLGWKSTRSLIATYGALDTVDEGWTIDLPYFRVADFNEVRTMSGIEPDSKGRAIPRFLPQGLAQVVRWIQNSMREIDEKNRVSALKDKWRSAIFYAIFMGIMLWFGPRILRFVVGWFAKHTG